MSAWVSRKWKEDGKWRHDRCKPGMKGVKPADRFVVQWLVPDGQKRTLRKTVKQIGRPGKLIADRLAREITVELEQGGHGPSSTTWAKFSAEYRLRIIAHKKPRTRELDEKVIAHFERIAKPGRLSTITTATIDAYKSARLLERGKNRGSTVSPLTVNRELRHLRAMLRVAHDWKMMREVPRFRMLKTRQTLPTYVTQDHFCAIYDAADAATFPQGMICTPGEWWRALVVTAYMTGWRIGELMAMRWADVDLDNGLAMTRAEDNKGGRDEWVPLHPEVIRHLRMLLAGSARLHGSGGLPADAHVFEWPYDKGTLYSQFCDVIQKQAGIHLECRKAHEHTDRCHVYGFHDLRRGFATMNAPSLTADTLQKLMRHRSYSTTRSYINLAPQLEGVAEQLRVPDRLRAGRASLN